MSDTQIDPHATEFWEDSEDDSESLADNLGSHSWFHFGDPNPTSELMRQAATRIRKLEREAAAALKAKEELQSYEKAWHEWRSLQTGDVQKLFDAALRCEAAEKAKEEAERDAQRWEQIARRHIDAALDEAMKKLKEKA